MNKILKIIILFSFFCILPHTTQAQYTKNEKKAIDIDFFTKVKSMSNLQEKDGNIYFIIRQPDQKINGYSSDLYQLIGGKPVELKKNVSDYFIQDDGIIYKDINSNGKGNASNGEKYTVFMKLGKGANEAKEWLRLPYVVNQILWIDNNHFFFTSTYDIHFENMVKENNGDRNKALQEQEKGKSYKIFDELPFWSNGAGNVSGLRTHLYYYDKGDVKLLTDTLGTIFSPEISPDKKTIVYSAKKNYYGKAPEKNYLVELNTETLEKRELNFFDQASYDYLKFIDNNNLILAVNRSFEHDYIQNSGIYTCNLKTEKLDEIYDGSIYGIVNSISNDVVAANKLNITSDKDGINYVTTNTDYAPLIHISYKNKEISFLTKDDISIQEYVPYKNGYLAIALLKQYGSEIYHIDKKGNATPLTEINKPLFDEYKVIKPEKITFTNENGILLNGYVLPPANLEKGKKYPAILEIHGGPKGAFGTVFFHEMQLLANQGYAVIYTNPTGSNGRGTEFSNIRGKVCGVDYRDLMTFLDTVLTKVDYIDGNRLGVTGGSYGGLMTNWIISHTNLFKAAVSLRSISSWISHSNTSDIGYSYTYSYWGTDLWKDGDLLWNNSPLKYADKVKTPALFIDSDEDYRCYNAEGLQMFYALQYFNVPSRMILFKGENHDLSRSGKPSNRIKRFEEMLNWFDKYLKNDM